VYLDEFGHIGPFLSRNDPRYQESPVFGLAGLILPIGEVRNFGTWFYQRKCDLLSWEIGQSGEHPATWEKKGSSLFTLTNITRYQELRHFTNRMLNKITKLGGHTFYVGLKKTSEPHEHSPLGLYKAVLREALKRLDQFCSDDCENESQFLVILDEHAMRPDLVRAAAMAMFDKSESRQCLIEPPFQVESQRYQTLQAADWIAGLVGRVSATWAKPDEYADWQPFRTYFEARINQASVRSGVRTSHI
jgi:hypothetical protein